MMWAAVTVRSSPRDSTKMIRLARRVGIKVRQARHRQNFPRARTHHDAANAFRAELPHGLRELLLDDVLDEHVDGQRGVEARARLNVLSAEHHNFALSAIGFSDPPAARALEFSVEPVLDSVNPNHLRSGGVHGAVGEKALHFLNVTEHMRGKPSARIDALKIILGVDPLAAKIAEERSFIPLQAGFVDVEIDLSKGLGHLEPLIVRHLAFEIGKLVCINDTGIVGAKQAKRMRQFRLVH